MVADAGRGPVPEKYAARARVLSWPRPIGAACGAAEARFLVVSVVRAVMGLVVDWLAIPGTSRLALRIAGGFFLGIDHDGCVAVQSYLRANFSPTTRVLWTTSPDEVSLVRDGRIFSTLAIQDRTIIMRRSCKDYAFGLWNRAPSAADERADGARIMSHG